MSTLLSRVSAQFVYASVSTSKEEQAHIMHLYPAPQYNGPAVIMRESSSARGEAVTSGPRPLTWNLGRLNPAKGGVIGLCVRGGEGQAEEVSGKTGKHQESK